MKKLYPMDMEEFMLALGEKDLVAQIKECFSTNTPLPSALHDAAMQLYRQYLVVGGKGTFRTLEEIKSSGTINIGVFSDKSPFGYVDENGEY